QVYTNTGAAGRSFTPGDGPGAGQIQAGQRKHWWVTVENNAAGSCRSEATEVTLERRTALPQPGTISGPTNLCPSSTYVYSIAGGAPASFTITDAISGDYSLATEYNWVLPAGWNPVSTSADGTSITVTTGAAV